MNCYLVTALYMPWYTVGSNHELVLHTFTTLLNQIMMKLNSIMRMRMVSGRVNTSLTSQAL